MVKPVSLSDPAFAALRTEKRSGESDSDVVLRLIAEVRSTRKDPLRFLRNCRRHQMVWPAEQYQEFLQRMDAADREKARRLWDAGH